MSETTDGTAVDPVARQAVRMLAVVTGFVALTGVVAAQSGGTTAGGMLCDGGPTALGELVNAALKIMFSVGIVAALGMYKFNTIVEMVTFSHSQKRRVKEKKRDVAKAVFVLAGAGPLFVLLAGSTFGSASCVTFIPWA